MSFERSSAKLAKIEPYLVAVIAIEIKTVSVVVQTVRQHGERVVDTGQQVGRGQSILKLASQSGLASRGRAIEEN